MAVRLILVFLVSGAAAIMPLFNVSRHYLGDLFAPSNGECPPEFCSAAGRRALPIPWTRCQCQCHPSTPTFREDRGECVSALEECGSHLASFSSTSATTETIPLVFLPKRHELVYSSAEIIISGPTAANQHPMCVVLNVKVLTEGGWEPMNNYSNFEPSFQTEAKNQRLFLKYTGENSWRSVMENKIILVNMTCKSQNPRQQTAAAIKNPYFQCVVFRGVRSEGLTETDAVNQRTNDYVIIGLCAGLLGVMYVGAVLIYLLVRWQRKNRENQKRSNEENGEEGQGERKSSNSNGHIIASSSLEGLDNPILTEPSTSTQVNITNEYNLNNQGKFSVESYQTRVEKAPTEGVPIEELPLDVGSNASGLQEDHPHAKIAEGSRRRLLFDPSYLDPDQLDSPPPAAIEFLCRIRDMIGVAKQKIRTNRFLPSLWVIPEEDDRNSQGNSAKERLRRKRSNPDHMYLISKDAHKKMESYEGIENEAFHLDVIEDDFEDAAILDINKDGSGMEPSKFDWISDEDDYAHYDQSKFRVEADGGLVDGMILHNQGGDSLMSHEDRFTYLARIPEDGELTDSFDGLYDFESFRREMVKKMQKKRRNHLKASSASGLLDLDVRYVNHNVEYNLDEWMADEDQIESEVDDDTEPHKMEDEKEESENENNKRSGGFKFSRSQMLQRVWSGDGEESKGNKKLHATLNGESDYNNHIPLCFSTSPTPSPSCRKLQRPTKTYIFGEYETHENNSTAEKVTSSAWWTPSSLFRLSWRDSNKTESSDNSSLPTSTPPRIGRAKRKTFTKEPANEIVAPDARPAWEKVSILGGGDSSTDSQQKQHTSEAHMTFKQPNGSAHSSSPTANRRTGKLSVNFRPNLLQKITGNNRASQDCSDNGASSRLDHSSNDILDYNGPHEKMNGVATVVIDATAPNGTQKIATEDSGYQSSDSDKSGGSLSAKLGSKIKFFKKMLATKINETEEIDSSSSSSSFLPNIQRSMLHMKQMQVNTKENGDNCVRTQANGDDGISQVTLGEWLSQEVGDDLIINYTGGGYQDKLNSVHENSQRTKDGDYAPMAFLSTLESSMELEEEDENSSSSEYADSLEGTSGLR